MTRKIVAGGSKEEQRANHLKRYAGEFFIRVINFYLFTSYFILLAVLKGLWDLSSLALGAQRLKYWTTREVPVINFF